MSTRVVVPVDKQAVQEMIYEMIRDNLTVNVSLDKVSTTYCRDDKLELKVELFWGDNNVSVSYSDVYLD